MEYIQFWALMVGHKKSRLKYFSNYKKRVDIKIPAIFFLVAISFLLFLIPSEQAYAITTINWALPAYSPLNGDAFGFTVPVTFTVEDTDLAGGGINTINVLITSSTGDSTTLTLVEDGLDNGMFSSTKLILMYENAEFQITESGTITIFDDCSMTGAGNCDPNAIETLVGGTGVGVFVGSTSEPGGIPFTLTETGEDTNLFTTQLKFSTSSSDPPSSTLLVSTGDTITIFDEATGAWVNGLIIPALIGEGAIQVEEFGIVTASYNGVSEQINIDPTGIPGRGGGGAIRPGLVLNFLIGGGFVLCDGDCIKPTLGLDSNSKRIVEKGFTYNGNSVDVESFYTPYPLVTVDIGQKNIAVLKIYENSGPQQISHVELAFGIGEYKSISESKAMIIWERNFAGVESIKVVDPENALQDVSIVAENGLCTKNTSSVCLILTIFHTFRDSLEFNMVGTNVWDITRNAQQNFYNHGIDIVGKSLNPPKQISVLDYRGHPTVLSLKDKDNGIDEDGNLWSRSGNYWIAEEKFVGRLDKPLDKHGIGRDNNLFLSYKKGQELLAENKFKELTNGKLIQNSEFGKNNNNQKIGNYNLEKHDLLLQNNLNDEIKRAQSIASKLFNFKTNY